MIFDVSAYFVLHMGIKGSNTSIIKTTNRVSFSITFYRKKKLETYLRGDDPPVSGY